MTTRTLPVDIPTIAYKSADTTDAKAFRRAAENLDLGYDLGGGGNLKAAVARLLRAAATALELAGQPDPPSSYYGYQKPAPDEPRCNCGHLMHTEHHGDTHRGSRACNHCPCPLAQTA